MEKNRQQAIEDTAKEIIRSAESTIIMNLRFLQCAMVALSWKPLMGSGLIQANGLVCYYDPALIIRKFKKEPNSIIRCYLHVLLHFVFHHNYEYGNKQDTIWDMACDIAVENTIMELGLYQTKLQADPEREIKLKVLKDRAGGLYASALYRLFLVEEPSIRETEELQKLFKCDIHELWLPQERMEIDLSEWKKISERVKADLKSFSKGHTDSESLKASLEDATRERINYDDFLRRFMVSREIIKMSDDEFDYIYYTYGLDMYGNIPLVEPLEYADRNKIRDFVIAIDTSASCKGELVEQFLRSTVAILSDGNNFFNEYVVHIIQADSLVRTDIVIHNNEELDLYIQDIQLTGFGSTDFRPVFDYVSELVDSGAFTNLKGLIYFTDGYGVYPEYIPEYETAFVFLKDDGHAPEVPDWAIQIVLDEQQIEKSGSKDVR